MDEKEKQKQLLMWELQWAKYRSEVLDIIESKLLQMRVIAERVQYEILDEIVKADLNRQLRCLAHQIKELDQESRKYEFNIDKIEH